MKIKKWLILTAPLALTVSTVPATLVSCGSETNLTPKVYSAETRTIPYYSASAISETEIQYIKAGFNINITHFNGSNVPYVDLDEYLQVMQNKFSATTSNYKTVICSMYNSEWCIIDYKKQTITFSDWDRFTNYNSDSYGPLAVGADDGASYFLDNVTVKYTPGKVHTLYLPDYNMKAYYYKNNMAGAVEHGFIPYHLLRNMFNINFVSAPCDYNGKGMYQIVDGNRPYAVSAAKLIRQQAADNFYNEEYMEYCYDLLALTLDCRFGLKTRSSRAVSQKLIHYLPNGAYDMLAPYHDKLVSTSLDDSSDALRKIFTEELDDGGHAGYHNLNALSSKMYDYGANRGLETKHTDDAFNKVGPARDKYKLSPKDMTGDSRAIGYFEMYENPDKEKGNIAYITFDSFEEDATSTWNETEALYQRSFPEYTNDDNYYLDTLRLTMYANQKIKDTNNNIKNVVIDITNNGGGAVYTEHFIASWLLGGVTEKIYNPTTGAYTEYTVKADVNGDGEFTKDDYISDVNLYVITASSSFSCGNMLPCNILDHAGERQGKTILMGTKSGGGACFVDDQMLTGLCSFFRSSSTFHMLRKTSSYNQYISNDGGAQITDGWEIDDMNSPEDLYKRSEINTRIWNNM